MALLILSIRSSDISNFASFDSNTTILCNASFFSYSKSVINLEILVSPSNTLSSLLLTSSFNLSILFIFPFADSPNSLSLLTS